jgi:hypothetical protein
MIDLVLLILHVLSRVDWSVFFHAAMNCSYCDSWFHFVPFDAVCFCLNFFMTCCCGGTVCLFCATTNQLSAWYRLLAVAWAHIIHEENWYVQRRKANWIEEIVAVTIKSEIKER